MIFRKNITESTNLDARSGAPGDVFMAEFQRAGRGRLNHVWQSAKSENLTFSMVLACGDLSPSDVATLPLVVGLAVAEGLERVLVGCAVPPAFLLKWPNDVLVRGRKVCGILCERAGDNVIAGIGVNVNQTTFAPEIAGRAVSLAQLAGGAVDRETVLQALIASVVAHHARWLASGFAALWPAFAARDILSGRRVSVRTTDDDVAPITGPCGGVQSDGSLLVGSERVFAGEAHVCSF